MENTGLFVFIWIWILKSSCADQSRCEPLFMCPTFCMKMKDGCYICNCGMFADYMKKSADEISRVSHEQSPQTGSQLSTYTSGYDVIEPKQSGTGTGFVDYRTMFRGVFSSDRPADQNPKQLSDLELQRYLFQNGGIQSPDFTNYDQTVGSMPGMGCRPVSKSCPASCISTDVYSGCIKCTCKAFQNKPTLSTATPTTSTPTSSASESIPNNPNKNNDKTPPVPFKIPTPAPNHIEQKIPTPMFTTNSLRHGNQLKGQGRNDNSLGHLSSKAEIIVPTLPTEADKQATKSNIFMENFNILDLFHPNKNRSQLEPPHDGVPPLTEINLHGGKVFTGQNKENHTNHSNHGIFVQRFPGYASPTPKPKDNNVSSIPSQQRPVSKDKHDTSFDRYTPKAEATTVKQSTYDDDKESSSMYMYNETGQDGLGDIVDNDRDIFDYLDEVVNDSNTVAKGGYFGNVIDKGLSLQEMTDIGTAF